MITISLIKLSLALKCRSDTAQKHTKSQLQNCIEKPHDPQQQNNVVTYSTVGIMNHMYHIFR